MHGIKTVLITGVTLILAFAGIYSLMTRPAAAAPVEYDLISSGDAKGLYRTGVNDRNQKLLEDVDDPHWVIDRVIRPAGMTNDTCQYAHRGGTTIVKIPSASAQTQIPARTIYERPNQAGLVAARDPTVTGDATIDDTGVRNLDGTSPWKFNVNNARWIGQNLYGQNTTFRNCKDPTNKTPKLMPEANIYVFKLKDGFTINDKIDLSSVKLKLSAAVDNTIKVVVNGTTVQARLNPGPANGWADVNTPGFASNSPSTETRETSGIFREGGATNSLELHVQSTYSHTGLLIKNIEMRGKEQAVASDYSAVPSVSIDKRAVTPGEQLTATPNVNTTGSASTGTAQWQLTRFVIVKGDGSPYPTTVQENTNNPVNHYRHDATQVSQGSRIFPVGSTMLGSSGALGEEHPAGTKICYATSIRPYSNTSASDSWRHSAPVCAVVGKKPMVHVYGGDLRVGRQFSNIAPIPRLESIVASTTTLQGGRTFGSWVEYGVVSPGQVINTGSASGLAGGSTGTEQADWSKLTFANDPEFGKFDETSGFIPDMSGAIRNLYDIAAAPEISGTVTPSWNGLRKASSDIVLNGYNFDRLGQTVVVYAPDKTVTISNNITYGSVVPKKLKDIPQLVIIANNIRINDRVDRIDGWLIAQGEEGRIDTCANVSSLTIAVCDKLLTVNGPVAAKQLLLKRTAGASTGNDAARSTPAEIFNLRADAYLWAYGIDSDSRRALTTYTSELPPRF